MHVAQAQEHGQRGDDGDVTSPVEIRDAFRESLSDDLIRPQQ